LLLRAVCLLNEAEKDALVEVSACLVLWLSVCEGAPAADGEEKVGARIARWRAGGGVGAPGADAAVAQGLLHLLHGREEALQAFSDALLAPSDETSCFGPEHRRAAKWNMLGAVLANRNRHKHALVAYEQALTAQPHYARALTNLGIAQQALPDPAAAAAAFTAALELVPDWSSPVIWQMLKKAIQEQPGERGAIAEAASQKSLPRLRELLGPALPQQRCSSMSATQVLREIGLIPAAAS